MATTNVNLLPPPRSSASSSPSPSTTTTTDTGLQFRRKLLHLQSLSVNPHKALTKNPNLRTASIETLTTIESTIASFGIERSALGRILDMFPQILTSDPYTDLYPVLDFLLHDVAIPFPDVRKSIIRCPRLLVTDVDNQLRPTLRFLEGLGFVGAHRITCRETLLLVSSVEGTLVRKVEYLKGLGFGEQEVKTMVVRVPALLTYSIERNFVPKVEYFVKEMKGDLEEIKRFPQFFSFSLEGKIKPRHRLLVEHGFKMSLFKMLKFSDGEFNVQLIEMKLRSASEPRLNKCVMEEQPFHKGDSPKEIEMAEVEPKALRSSDAQDVAGEQSLRWQPPPPGYVKINVDAAVRDDATFVGCIARNHKGKALKAYSARFPAFDPLTAEAEGFKAAARWAILMGFENVIIEGDAKRVVDSYNKGFPYRHQIAPTLHRMSGLSRSLEAAEVKFVHRECNYAAHELCQWAARTGKVGHINGQALPGIVCDIVKVEVCVNAGVHRKGLDHVNNS